LAIPVSTDTAAEKLIISWAIFNLVRDLIRCPASQPASQSTGCVRIPSDFKYNLDAA